MGNCFTIVGNEPVLVKNKIDDILNIYRNVNYDKIVFDMEEASLISLLEELQTFPFLEEHKIIIAKNFNSLLENKKVDERLIDELKGYLDNQLETSSLIVLLEKKYEGSSDLYDELKKNSNFFDLVVPETGDVSQYILKVLQANDFIMNTRAIDELILRTQGSLQQSMTELDKLMVYKCDTKTIEIEDVIKLVNKNLEDSVYTLIDAILVKDSYRIMEIYNDMMVLNEDESRIISAILSKFNEMYEIKSLVDGGYKKDDIASLYNVKPGRVFYMMKNASSTSMRAIKKNINELTNLDYNIKSGSMDKKIGLQLYLLSIK